MRGQLAPGPAREYGHAEGQQQILQDLQVALHCLALHLALAGHVADVDRLTVREAHHLKEAREGADASHQALHLHLFPQVERRVGSEDIAGLRRGQHQRHQPVTERSRE